MCVQVWDCDCHLEDPPEDTVGMTFVRPVRFGTRRSVDGGYYVHLPCGSCGVYGHPCKCEVKE
jgi:hypothetical protein